MPGGDRAGPLGMGPMTGRAAGYCAGSAVPGFMNAPGGQGFRRGGGGRGGRGWRNRFYATGLTGWQRAAGMPAFAGRQVAAAAQAETGAPPAPSREQELDILKRQAETVEQQMKQLRERIGQLEAEN